MVFNSELCMVFSLLACYVMICLVVVLALNTKSGAKTKSGANAVWPIGSDTKYHADSADSVTDLADSVEELVTAIQLNRWKKTTDSAESVFCGIGVTSLLIQSGAPN